MLDDFGDYPLYFNKHNGEVFALLDVTQRPTSKGQHP